MNWADGLMVEKGKFVWAAEPKNYTGAANTKLYVNMALYNHLTIIIQVGAWAGGTAAVTLAQANTQAGGSSKALAFNLAFQWAATSASDVYTKTAVVSDTFNISVANTINIIEVEAQDLDLTNNFNYVSVAIASPGGNNDLYGVIYYLSQPRFAQASPPSALV